MRLGVVGVLSSDADDGGRLYCSKNKTVKIQETFELYGMSLEID